MPETSTLFGNLPNTSGAAFDRLFMSPCPNCLPFLLVRLVLEGRVYLHLQISIIRRQLLDLLELVFCFFILAGGQVAHAEMVMGQRNIGERRHGNFKQRNGSGVIGPLIVDPADGIFKLWDRRILEKDCQ